MKKNEKGFSFVEIMLVLIFISLIGFIGWYVLNNNKNSSASKPATATTSATTPTTSKRYLSIKEEGVKFELPSKLSDAYYYVNPAGLIYISLHRYDSMKGFEGCTAKGGYNNNGSGLAALDAAQPGDDHFGSPYTEKELQDIGKKIGNKYYWLESNAQAPCYDAQNISESDQRVQDMHQLRALLVNQSSTITSI